MSGFSLDGQRRRRTLDRRLREAKLLIRGALDTDHPIMAHIIPIRRCNLACAYCNEYDTYSKPVPLDTIRHRLALLGKLKTGVVTLSGGEPLLHPDLDDIIRAIRQHATLAGLITNGYLLTAERIQRLNDAGLDYLQISIDNVMPDDVSKKSLKVLDKKLHMFKKLLDEGRAGDNVGLLLRGIEKTDVERGQVIAKPGSIKPFKKFRGEVYVLSKEEGGRHTPFFNGYRPQFYFRTTDVTGVMRLRRSRYM
jgi:uncharacterized radical SAM superfamily Fe-S cluster-containing enzyme